MVCAARIQISFTALTPVQLLRITGNIATNPTRMIDPLSPRPNQRRKSGA
jgi:hypothetical protein